MERTDRRPILSAQLNKIEPSFVPQWLRSSNSSSNHVSDDRGRNNYVTERSTVTSERNFSSLRRSSSTNGSHCNEKEKTIHLRPYSSFGRNKDFNFLEKRKPAILENGSNNFSDLSLSSRNKTFASSNSNITSSITKSSFEKEFPSLKSEEKQGTHDPVRVQKLTGGDNWTSALAEAPSPVGTSGLNGPFSSVSGSMTGLNMAEALAQAPPQTRGALPKISTETQRMEELALKQSRQLVPVMSLTPKALGVGSSEKAKNKVSRVVDREFSKAGQPVSHALRLSKPSQTGNFHVLNRERNSGNGIVPTAKDSLQSPVHDPLGVKSKSDGRGAALPVSAFIERRPPATQQNRSEFFNSLRKKTSASTSSSSSTSQLTSMEKPEAQETVAVDSVEKMSKEEPLRDASGNDGSNEEEKDKGSCLDPEEEERLLRLFGWKENTGEEEEEALTAEEIGAFLEEYQKRLPPSKFGLRNLNLPAVPGSGDSEKRCESSGAAAF